MAASGCGHRSRPGKFRFRIVGLLRRLAMTEPLADLRLSLTVAVFVTQLKK
jgi:hypothetical protein